MKLAKLNANYFEVENVQVEEVQLNNGFRVDKFMAAVQLDYVFARKSDKEDTFLLLNQDVFGEIPKLDIELLAQTKKVAVIDNDHMNMFVFNVPTSDLFPGLLQ